MDPFEYLRIDKQLDQLPSSYFSILAGMLEDSLGGTKAELEEFSEFLVKTLQEQLRVCDKSVRTAVIDGKGASPELQQAYALGQLSLAQHLISSMCSRRADDSFTPTLLQRKYRDLLKLLLAQDMTGIDLAKATQSSPETISRKLRLLREMGAADFRRDGTHIINFLTLVAKDVLAHHGIKKKSLRAAP